MILETCKKVDFGGCTPSWMLGRVFVFDFKMVEQVEETEVMLAMALQQMQKRGSADTSRDRQEPVHLVAVVCVCSRDARNLLDLRVEPVDRGSRFCEYL